MAEAETEDRGRDRWPRPRPRTEAETDGRGRDRGPRPRLMARGRDRRRIRRKPRRTPSRERGVMFEVEERALEAVTALRGAVETIARHNSGLADQILRAASSIVLNVA